jgi:hypothetical protein
VNDLAAVTAVSEDEVVWKWISGFSEADHTAHIGTYARLIVHVY